MSAERLQIDPDEIRGLLSTWSQQVNQYNDLILTGTTNLEALKEAAPGNNTIKGIHAGFKTMGTSFSNIIDMVGQTGKEDNSTVCGVIETSLNNYVEQLDNERDVDELMD